MSDKEGIVVLEHELSMVLQRLKSGLREALQGSSGEPARGGSGEQAACGGDQPSSATPGLDLLAAMTGTPRETLTGDYAAIGRAVREYLSDTARTARDAVSGEPDRMQAARERMAAWRETLRRHGIDVPADTAVTDGPEPASTAPRPPSASAPDHNGAEATRGLADSLRRLAETFRQRADALAAGRTAAPKPPTDSGDGKA